MGVWEVKFRDIKVKGGVHTYKPSEDTLLLAWNISKLTDYADVVIDVGTGSGILAILVGKDGRYSIAIDISFDALMDARENIWLNNVDECIDIVQCDALECIRESSKGVSIVSNPPYLPGIHDLVDDHIYIGGEDGVEVALKICGWICRGKDVDGYIILSSYSNIRRFEDVLREMGCRYEVIDKIGLDGESIFLYKVGGGG